MTVATPQEAPVTDVAKSSGTRLVDRVFKMRELAILAVFVVMIVVTQLGNSEFLTEQGIKDLLLNATILVLVLISRNASFIRVNMPASIGKPFFPG